MVFIASSSAFTRLQQILLTTAKHFDIRVLPNPQLVLSQGEFIDPLPFRWSDLRAPCILHMELQ